MHYNIWGLLCDMHAMAKKKKTSVGSECSICDHYIHIIVVVQVVGFMS
jgi:hypothetical protein